MDKGRNGDSGDSIPFAIFVDFSVALILVTHERDPLVLLPIE